jgi:hypothetical protein
LDDLDGDVEGNSPGTIDLHEGGASKVRALGLGRERIEAGA